MITGTSMPAWAAGDGAPGTWGSLSPVPKSNPDVLTCVSGLILLGVASATGRSGVAVLGEALRTVGRQERSVFTGQERDERVEGHEGFRDVVLRKQGEVERVGGSR